MHTIGFKGTRHGMTEAQREALRRALAGMERSEFHYGDYLGADAEAAEIAVRCSWWAVRHPSIEDAACQAQTELVTETMKPQAELARYRFIVHRSDLLIACPHNMVAIENDSLGETAFTVNHARSHGKEVWIIWPDGSIEKEAPAIEARISDPRMTLERRIRAETIYINRIPVVFFKCPKKKRWCIRVIGGRVKFAKKKSK
jgi:hypothetical protein